MTESRMMAEQHHEVRDTLAISVPLVTSQLVYASSTFISTAMVANLGEASLAATVIVNLIWMCLSVFFFGILNAISGMVAHEYGAKNLPQISRLMGQAFILSLFIAGAISALLLSIPFFIHLSAQPPHVLAIAKAYNTSLIWMIPALVFLITTEQFLAGIHRTKIVLRLSLIVVPLEIGLIYCLMFGGFGIPRCGVAGIGYGFAISYTLSAIGLLVYLCVKQSYRQFHLFHHIFTFDWGLFKSLCQTGLTFGLAQLIEISTFALVTFWIGHFGTTILAAHQIGIQYLTFFSTLLFSMSQAVMIRVSHAIGANHQHRLYAASFIGMGLNGLLMVALAISFYGVPHIFLSLDLNVHAISNTALMTDASRLLAIGGLLLLFDNFRIVGIGALRGLKDTRFPLIITFVSFWVIGCPAAYYLGFIERQGGYGIWWGITMGVLFGALAVQWRLFSRLKNSQLAAPNQNAAS